jgi:hypothetical protein
VRISTVLLAAIGEKTQSSAPSSVACFAVDVKNGATNRGGAASWPHARVSRAAKQRALGIVAGLALIRAVNLFRIVSLFWPGAPSRRVRPVSRCGGQLSSCSPSGSSSPGAGARAQIMLKPTARGLVGSFSVSRSVGGDARHNRFRGPAGDPRLPAAEGRASTPNGAS